MESHFVLVIIAVAVVALIVIAVLEERKRKKAKVIQKCRSCGRDYHQTEFRCPNCKTPNPLCSIKVMGKDIDFSDVYEKLATDPEARRRLDKYNESEEAKRQSEKEVASHSVAVISKARDECIIPEGICDNCGNKVPFGYCECEDCQHPYNGWSNVWRREHLKEAWYVFKNGSTKVVWTTRDDDLVCDACKERHLKLFTAEELVKELEGIFCQPKTNGHCRCIIGPPARCYECGRLSPSLDTQCPCGVKRLCD